MKEKYNQLISDTVKPLLKLNGFAKKGMNFYKMKEDLIFLINLQNSHGTLLVKQNSTLIVVFIRQVLTK